MARLLLGRKEFEFLIAVLAAALLLLVAKANSQCPQGLPLFGDRTPNTRLPDKIQAILPTYTFTCSGPVVQWGACVQPRGNDERYDIYFEVWRSTGVDGCYSIVGSNFVNNGDPDIPRGCIVYDVPEGQRIMVEAGDVMGFYSDHNDDRGGIEVDTAVSLDVWYRTLSNNPTQSDLEDSSLCIGATGDLNTFSDSGAPVITAMVDNSRCLLSAPLFGDRSGGDPKLPNSIQAIIPAYTFTCRGSVVQWGACVDPREDNNEYDIYFEVWRPTDTSGCYSLVGSNFVDNGAPGNIHNVRACVVIDVPEDEQVIVEPGDVVGFYSDHVNGNGGVELDEGTQYANLEVWYRNPSQNDLEANSLCVGVGEDLSTRHAGEAPVITAKIAADCGNLTNPANGSVSLTMTTFDSLASYSCSDSNNFLLGDAVRTCQADGMWNGTAPTCVVDCGSLQDPENGMVTVTETTVGSTANYSCSGSNYLLVGAAERTCQADGMWSGSAPECVINCGSLQDPENGLVAVTETTFGSTASYSCSGSNYLLVGAAERTCQANGMWSESAPQCNEVCDILTNPMNGEVVFTERFVSSVANYSCDIGFELVGSETRTCQSGSGWSGMETSCELVDCNSLANPGNGTVSATTTTFGSVANYSCNGSRYLLVGNATRMCQANGEWSGGAPACEEVCDALTNPMNGDIMFSNGTFVGSVATYSCTMGFESVGSETRTCQSGTGWSGMDPSCERMCDPLDDPVNGQVMLTTRTQGSVASYSCETGYNLTGNNSRVCQMATDELEWSDGDPICQIVDCNSLANPGNGTVSATTTTFGSVASYSCSGSRYLLVGNATRMCQANGEWSGGVPTCEEVCDALTNPMNGDIMFSNGTFVGSVATYSCTMGFESVGSETRTCQSGTGWSGMEPSCERMCDPLDDPVNGQVMLTTRTQGSVASYSCETGYNLTGNSSRMCQMATDGLEWSDSDPVCQIVDCGTLTSPANGTILLDTTLFGSTVTYSCSNSDHQLVGDAMRTCQANGMWSGSAPTCDLVSSQEQSQSQVGIIGGVVAGVLVVVALAVLVALAIVYKKRKGSFTLHSKAKSRDRTDTQQFGYELQNPLYSGVLTQPKFSSLTDTGETVYENPDHQRLGNNYEDPEEMDIYRTMSNVPLIERGHRTLMDTNGSYEWSIYVPTQEQRRAVTSSKGQHEDMYAALGEVQKPQDSFFDVSNIYWSPSSDPNELYDQLSKNKYREIPQKLIQTTEHLGSGQFGSVQKGIWQTKTGAVEIAVKMLKAGTSQDDEVRFLQEAAINGQFQHPNIVKLLGVVTVGQPVMIVLELLSNGDLRNYLIRQQPVPGELLPSDTPHMLLQFCQEVASGMEYLSQKAFVHRDLAARNILVAADRTCKISDFGMSRDLENETYYVSHGGKIPVKWTAPEALHFKKYSTASDVWSYGALVYEIWSIGCKPFQSYTNQEAMKLVDSGVRLPPPPGCPKEIYKVMIRCWHPDTSSRPSFTEVVEALSEPEIESDLLCWSEEDTAVHPQAAVLGAPLEAGVDLYPELQGTYT